MLAIAPPEPVFPVPVIELHGSGAEMGAQHAKQLGDNIRLLHKQYLEAWFDTPTKKFLATTVADAFMNRVIPAHRDEITSLANSAGIQPSEIMLAQCFLDLAPMTGCSTITLPAEASPDGIARFGRNLDFPSFNVADKQTAVFIVRPKDHYAFAAVGWPGLVGVLSGMNEHGLCLANMEVERPGRLPVAMPYMLLYRTVLERCRTVDEAIAYLKVTPRQTANNLMLMDADGNRAVAEIRPEGVTIRRGVSGEALMSTNHQRGQDTRTTGSCWRYDLLRKMSDAQFGNIDEIAMQQFLGKAAQGKMTLQSMIFEPSTRTLYLAVGHDAPNKSEFHSLDLKSLFEE